MEDYRYLVKETCVLDRHKGAYIPYRWLFHEAFRSSARGVVIVVIIAVASLGRLPRNRSIPVWFTRYPRTALSDRWRSLGITSLMNIGGIRYVHIHSYIGHHDQACVLACKIQCISKFHEIKLKS
ncbi:hypothetical protein TNCV_5119201 [Trichonephila clavipes]|nr:hypothetical protein TNCV_5119201 [Trichonephila clavipes]